MPIDDAAITGAIEAASAEITSATEAEGVTDPPGTDPDPAVDTSAAAEGDTGVPQIEGGKKNNGIMRHDRHQAILTRKENEWKAKHEAELKARDTRLESYKQFDDQSVKDWVEARELAGGNPEAFAKILLSLNPEYAKFIRFGEPAQTGATTDPNDPEPQPDVLNEDGSAGFSQAGLAKFVRWQARQDRRDEMGKLEARIKPFEERQALEKAYGESLTRQKAKLQNALDTWPGLRDHFDAAKQYLAQNQKASLEEAYRAAVVPNLTIDKTAFEADLRKKILAEMSTTKPAHNVAAPGRLPSPSSTSAESSDDAIERIIRDNARRLSA